jgi:hypothetical protein
MGKNGGQTKQRVSRPYCGCTDDDEANGVVVENMEASATAKIDEDFTS